MVIHPYQRGLLMRGLQRYSVDEPVSKGTRLSMEYVGSVGAMVMWETAELSDRVERAARDEEETTRVFNNKVGRLNRELTEVRNGMQELRVVLAEERVARQDLAWLLAEERQRNSDWEDAHAECQLIINNHVARLQGALQGAVELMTLGTRPPVLTRYLLSTLWFCV